LLDDSFEQVVSVLNVAFLLGFTLFFDFLAELLEFRRIPLSFSCHIDQPLRIILHLHGAHVQNHQLGADPRRRLNRFRRVFEGILPLASIGRSKLENIRRGVVDADGERTKIVQRGNLDLTRVHRFQHSRQQADADAVAQLRVFKPQIANLSQHGASVRVTAGIPASR